MKATRYLILFTLACLISGCATTSSKSNAKKATTADLKITHNFYDFEEVTKQMYKAGKDKYKSVIDALIDNQKVRLELIQIDNNSIPNQDNYEIQPGKHSLTYYANSVANGRKKTMKHKINMEYKVGHKYIAFATPSLEEGNNDWHFYTLDVTSGKLTEN